METTTRIERGEGGTNPNPTVIEGSGTMTLIVTGVEIGMGRETVERKTTEITTDDENVVVNWTKTDIAVPPRTEIEKGDELLRYLLFCIMYSLE